MSFALMNHLAEGGLKPADIENIEAALMTGNLKNMTPVQRLGYYNALCKSVDLNPLTMPFQYLELQGKLVLYANKSCAEQLRSNKGISIYDVTKEVVDGMLVVTAHGRDKEGREDTSTAALDVSGMKGEAKANAFMKCETKAKRRLTLSLAGMGMLDETEVQTIQGARQVEHAQVHAAPAKAAPAAAPAPQAPKPTAPVVVDEVNENVLMDFTQTMSEETDLAEVENLHNRFADAYKKSPATVGAAWDIYQKRLKELKK